MKFLLRGILLLTCGLLLLQVDAYGENEPKDSLTINEKPAITKHIPARATIFSAVLPGLGQAYNNKHWKMPIVWGGFIGLGYMVNYYHNGYANYKTAYFDLNDNNPNTKSYETVYPVNGNDYSDVSNYNSIFTSRIEAYRDQRDLYIIITAGFYLLNILDANVDAHFIDFDISEDLTVSIEPAFINQMQNTPVFGGQLTFTF